MGNVMAYSGIVTKVHGMQAKLLSEEELEEVASKKTVPEVIEYLKEKPAYAEYMNRLEVKLYHRRNVEKVLYQSLYADWSRLFRFAGMEQKKGTEYYEPLIKIKDSGAATLFDYDLALDLYYFTTLWRKQRRLLKKKELEIYTRDCGTKIDLLNIQWIYRAKKYYHLLPPDIYALTIPIHYRLNLEDFKMLVDTPSVEEFQNRLDETYYAKKYEIGKEQKTMEQIYQDCLRQLYLSDRRREPYSIASISTYLFLKEEEIKKLTTAFECIRYGLTTTETLAYMKGVIR